MKKGDTVHLMKYGTFNIIVATFLGIETSYDHQHDLTDITYITDKGHFQIGYAEYTAYTSLQEIVEIFERTELFRAIDRLKQARKKLRELKKLEHMPVAQQTTGKQRKKAVAP